MRASAERRVPPTTAAFLGRGLGGYAALAAGAWLALALVHGSERSWYFGHEVLGAPTISPPLAVGTFMAGWLLMTLAMMLPGSLPELASRRRRGTGGQAAMWLAGDLSPWLLLGFAFATADLLMHGVVAPLWPLWAARAPALLWLAAGAHRLVLASGNGARDPSAPTLRAAVGGDSAAAGGYLALAAGAFGARRSRGGRAAAFVSGWRTGLACLRSGWLLMLAVAGAGHGELVAMAAATLLMSAPAYRPLPRWVDAGAGCAMGVLGALTL